MRFLLIIVLTLGVSLAGTQEASAQKKKSWFRDIFRVKAPELEYVEPDTLQKKFNDPLVNYGGGGEEEIEVDLLAEEEDFNSGYLKRGLSIVSEDTIAYVPEMEVLVEVSEQLMINKDWITLHEYYSVWDSWNINPYEVDATKFADTVSLNLFDTLTTSWSKPLDETRVTSDFGFRRYRWHYGTDIALNTGDSVRTVFDGIVRIKKYDPSGYGYYLLVRHKNGLETLYGHLSNQLVEVGDEVKAGDVIGLGGSTGRSSGPHLHFEFRFQGNPLNPSDVYDFEQNALLSETLLVTPETFSYMKEARKVHFHKVRRGDTLSGISKRHGVSINKLCSLNGIRKNSVLRVGQRLRIN